MEFDPEKKKIKEYEGYLVLIILYSIEISYN